MKKIFFVLMIMASNVFANDVSDWQKIYEDVKSAYVYKVDVADLAIALLKGMPNVDKNLQVGNDGSKISLYYKGRVEAVARKPDNPNDAKAWAKVTEKIIAKAIDKSEKAQQRDFEIDDILAKDMIKILDKDSKFYPDFDSANGIKADNHRTFAARMEDNALYIKIGVFNKQTVANLKQVLNDNEDGDAIIVDLKGCSGGVTKEAIEAIDLFLDGGIIVSTVGRDREEEVFYNAKDDKYWGMKPVYVLVDGATASSAEIFAAAIQEQSRGKVIGTTTKGKGTMQKLLKLPSGSVLAVTNLFYKTPSGKGLDGNGVKPDICTFEMPDDRNIEGLLRLKHDRCMAEHREDAELELNVALHLINS